METPILENDRVRLSQLNFSNYKQLANIASEKDLLLFSPSNISTPDALHSYVEIAINGYDEEITLPFIIFDKKKKQYAGSTRFGLIQWKNKVLHIGWTWIGKEFQGTGLNKNVKFLMLNYAFETLEFEKVEFRIDERNQRSRKAVENIGGQLEGILRKDTLMTDGFRRNTCCYGILKEDWSILKTTIFSDVD